jgi:ubiquinone/menaquinone biosynthesis C-methylase UbiE
MSQSEASKVQHSSPCIFELSRCNIAIFTMAEKDETASVAFAKSFVEFLHPLDGAHILDLGCGRGDTSFAAAQAAGSQGFVTSINNSESALTKARQRSNEAEIKNVEFHLHNIDELDTLAAIQEKEFDAIICSSSITSLKSPLKAIRSWFKYLKVGGSFVIGFNHPNSSVIDTVLEIASARVGVKSRSSTTLIDGDQTIRELLKACSLELDSIELRERLGFGTRYLTIADGESTWEQLHDSERFAAFCNAAGDQAKEHFLKDWMLCADETGKIKEYDGVYLAKARKLVNSLSPFPLHGSCACGYTQYESAMLPFAVCQCCCKPCRKVSGSPFLMMMEIPTWAVIFTPSLLELPSVSLMPQATRTFCPKCGSTWSFQAFRCLDSVEIAMATIDEEKLEGITSTDIMSKADKKWCWTTSKVGWWSIPDDGWRREERMQSESKTVVYN